MISVEMTQHVGPFSIPVRPEVSSMTPEETKRMFELCKKIQTEKDQETFNTLVRELNDLLAKKQTRLAPNPPATHS